MADPVPLSKEDRAFSFGKDVNLSLSGDGKSAPAAAEAAATALGKQDGTGSPPADLERTSSLKQGPPRLLKGSVRFDPNHININLPYDFTRPVSDAASLSSTRLAYPESSKLSPPLEKDLTDSPEEPSDYDIFLQKSRAEFERDKQRNWPTVEIDDSSFTNLPSSASAKNADRRKLFAMVRKILRCLQVFTRLSHRSQVNELTWLVWWSWRWCR